MWASPRALDSSRPCRRSAAHPRRAPSRAAARCRQAFRRASGRARRGGSIASSTPCKNPPAGARSARTVYASSRGGRGAFGGGAGMREQAPAARRCRRREPPPPLRPRSSYALSSDPQHGRSPAAGPVEQPHTSHHRRPAHPLPHRASKASQRHPNALTLDAREHAGGRAREPRLASPAPPINRPGDHIAACRRPATTAARRRPRAHNGPEAADEQQPGDKRRQHECLERNGRRRSPVVTPRIITRPTAPRAAHRPASPTATAACAPVIAPSAPADAGGCAAISSRSRRRPSRLSVLLRLSSSSRLTRTFSLMACELLLRRSRGSGRASSTEPKPPWAVGSR